MTTEAIHRLLSRLLFSARPTARSSGARRGTVVLALLLGASNLGAAPVDPSEAGAPADLHFEDRFDGGLDGWTLEGADAIEIVDTGDPAHGRALQLEAEGRVLALVRGSERWGPVRIELDVLFPRDDHAYLGLIYHFEERTVRGSERTDFGSLYIKGNGSYVRANPWRDGNVSRLLYEEYKTRLEGAAAIEVDRWQRVALEVAGADCHLYVGEVSGPQAVPQLTFALYEGRRGKVGFNPRVSGAPVWIDNVVVRSIDALSYGGPPIPSIAYRPQELLIHWQVAGPFARPMRAIERGGATQQPSIEWRPFATDPRGAVVTGRVTEYDGPRSVAYFRTVVPSERTTSAVLELSTTDELALWVNGGFHGFIYRNGYVFGERDWNAWHDFWANGEHAGATVEIDLREGENELLFRARNGQFASGGFFARLLSER